MTFPPQLSGSLEIQFVWDRDDTYLPLFTSFLIMNWCPSSCGSEASKVYVRPCVCFEYNSYLIDVF